MVVDPRIVPVVVNTMQTGTRNSPRIESVLTNPSATALSNVQVVVLVYDAQENLIAASKTVMSSIPAQGQATAIFTWNSAFVGVPASINVVPIIPLP
jgi:hypothetical protein